MKQRQNTRLWLRLSTWWRGIGPVALLVLGWGIAGCTDTNGLTDGLRPESTGILVKRVIDGDTIELSTGQRVRYLGVDTPETVHPDKPIECYGPEASAANRTLVEGKRVQLETDISDRDKYGRLLRYVSVDGQDVAAKLIREGYAYVYSRKPDIARLKTYAALERAAREARVGLWADCHQ